MFWDIKKICLIYNHIMTVCLPYYKKKFLKTLTESAVANRAIVTTNAPKYKDSIINNRKLFKEFSFNSFKFAKKKFDKIFFLQENMKFYEN